MTTLFNKTDILVIVACILYWYIIIGAYAYSKSIRNFIDNHIENGGDEKDGM